MNHSFIAAVWSNKVCAKCAKPESVHSDSVICEACSNVGPVEIVGKLLLCASCEAKEKEVKPSPEQQEQLSLERIRQQVDRLVDSHAIVNTHDESIKTIIDEAITGNIKQYTDFFNAKTLSITELKELVDNDESIPADQKKYALARMLRERIQYLARVLFQTRDAQIKMSGEVKSIQHYMSVLIPELRMKLRNEFANLTPAYTPIAIKSNEVKQKAGKKSQADKLAESYAKMMKIPIEQAKRLLENKLRDECSCSETPGMCKVHNT